MNIYLQMVPSELFSGPDYTAIVIYAPVAQEIVGLSVGEGFNFNVNGKVRGCEVLEIY